MYRAHKIALNPNRAQANYFVRASGTARFAWNWALAEWKRQYAAGEKPNQLALRRKLNEIKREQFAWMYDVTKLAPQNAIINLGEAFQRFFKKVGGYPAFKRQGERDSFVAADCATPILANGKRLRLPIIGWVKMREAVRFSGKIMSVTISRTADRWFASLLVSSVSPDLEPKKSDFVGVDLGIKALATLSDGSVVNGPKAHKTSLKRLRRANKALARRKLGSQNWKKAKAHLARVHARIANVRRDSLHKLTTHLTRTFRHIGVENLSTSALIRNRRLSRAICDMGWGEFRRQIDYKALIYGSTIHLVDRFFPSSKTCSCCGVVKPTLALSERVFRCTDCGTQIDRDVNAARNIEMAARSAVTACGDSSADALQSQLVKLGSEKQEINQPTAMAVVWG